MAAAPGTAQPPAPGGTQGKAHGSSQPKSSGLQTAQSLKLFALSHLQGASDTPVSSKPPLHTALLHSCHAVMEAQLSPHQQQLIVLSRARVAPGPHPILSCWGTELCSTSHHHPLQRATLLTCLNARSKSHFLKKISFSLCANSHHLTLCDCSPPWGQQWTKGTEAAPL